MGLRREGRLFLVALQFFTRLPVPSFPDFDPAWLNAAGRWFPSVGLVVGGLSALALWLAALVLPWPLAAAVALAVSLWITGAFHEDGLADTFDALGGHVSRERALQIMRDSRIGTYGAAALAFDLLLRWQAIAAMSPLLALAALPASHTAARAGAASLMAGLDYVRPEDDSKAKPIATALGGGSLAMVLLTGALPTAVLVALWPGMLLPLLAGLPAVLLVHLYCRRWFRHRLGGYTGDALGCAEQMGEIGFLLAVLAAARWLG